MNDYFYNNGTLVLLEKKKREHIQHHIQEEKTLNIFLSMMELSLRKNPLLDIGQDPKYAFDLCLYLSL